MLELQGDQNIAMALAHAAVKQQTQLNQDVKQQNLYKDMSAVCTAKWSHKKQLALQHMILGQQQQLCWHMAFGAALQAHMCGLVLVLLQQLTTAEQQQAASMQAQERLQQDILKLKRSLAAAQQRKDSAESKLKVLKQESKALSVALKAVASMLVDKSEQKAELQCSAEMGQHQTLPQLPASVRPLLQQCAAAQQLLLVHEQQPPAPSGARISTSRRASGVQDVGLHAAVLELEDLRGGWNSRAASDQVTALAECQQAYSAAYSPAGCPLRISKHSPHCPKTGMTFVLCLRLLQVLSPASVESVQASCDPCSPDVASSFQAPAQQQQGTSLPAEPAALSKGDWQSPSCSSSGSHCGPVMSGSRAPHIRQHSGQGTCLESPEVTFSSWQGVSSAEACVRSSYTATAGAARQSRRCSGVQGSTGSGASKSGDTDRPRWR